MKKVLRATVLALVSAGSSRAAIIITEVDPAGSANSSYAADWFELTNTGSSAQDISGWKMDDNSNSFALAVPIRDITSIPAGASVVFIEGNTAGTNDATVQANFESAWFGSSVPAGFLIAGYGGAGVGLSQTSDAVNIFDSSGTPITGVTFGVTTLGTTLDNSAGASGAISTTSVAGVHGAFLSSDGRETGSPGTVPEPASLSLLAGATLLLTRRRSK